MHKPDCIFCQIARGEAPCHKVWENDDYLAFLSIYPNTEGVTVVIPKEHHDSYVFAVPDEVYHGIMDAARTTARLLDTTFEDVGRTGLIFEGFGVDHLHAKLYPMHGTNGETWEKRESSDRKYFEKYEGFLSSHDYERADDASLSELAQKIRKLHEGE